MGLFASSTGGVGNKLINNQVFTGNTEIDWFSETPTGSVHSGRGFGSITHGKQKGVKFIIKVL